MAPWNGPSNVKLKTQNTMVHEGICSSSLAPTQQLGLNVALCQSTAGEEIQWANPVTCTVPLLIEDVCRMTNQFDRFSLFHSRQHADSRPNLISHRLYCSKLLQLLGPFHGAIAVPSVTRCRCRRCRRRCR